MKKIIYIIVVVSIIFSCIIVSMAENVDIEFNITDDIRYGKDNITWTGKEWLTAEYPPALLHDGEFVEITEENEFVKSVLKNNQIQYVWTGQDYLTYFKTHDYRMNNNKKYLYRISEDFDRIINTYEVPDWIDYLYIHDGKIFIITESVKPVYIGDSQRVGGERSCNFKAYYSHDCINWNEIDVDLNKSEIGYKPSLYSANNALLMVCYHNPTLEQHSQISDRVWRIQDDTLHSVIYENRVITKINNYNGLFCTQEYVDGGLTNKILVSIDGIYWDELSLPIDGYLREAYEDGTNISFVMESNNTMLNCNVNKEALYDNLSINQCKDAVYVVLNNEILAFEKKPIIEDGRTLVPMRFLFEQMGADVEWNDETKTAKAILNNTMVSFSIDDTNAEVNSEPVTMDIPAQLVNGKTMVPLRFLSEELGYTVTWDEETRTAVIE